MSSGKRILKGSPHASPETRRAELIDAAIICFGQKGYYPTTIDHIAKQAGLSKGSVYRFFESKDHILLAIIEKYEKETDELLAKGLESVDCPKEMLRLSFRISIEYFSQKVDMDRVWREFIFHPIAEKEVERLWIQGREEFESILKMGVDRGMVEDQELTPLIDMLIAIHEGLLDMRGYQADFDVVSRFDATWNLIERAIFLPESKWK